MTYATALSCDLTPARLDYIAALRGVTAPASSGTFLYVRGGAFDLDAFLCLAASNPQGRFWGVMDGPEAVSKALFRAQTLTVSNVSFVASLEAVPDGVHYFCCEGQSVPGEEGGLWEGVFSVAEKKLAPGGLFTLLYPVGEALDSGLRFLIQEYASDLSAAQWKEFLSEIKTLGVRFFEAHPALHAALDKAIETGVPSLFCDVACGQDARPVVSGAFSVMAALLPRGFSFVGDADYGMNYLELAAPASTHETLLKCREHLLYESIKDFSLNRLVRHDVWVKRPVSQTDDLAALFGAMTFGITMSRTLVPEIVKTQGGEVSLGTPLLTRLIDLMCVLPMGIGDFLAHPSGFGQDAAQVVTALQLLVALGIAQPMRGRYEGVKTADTSRPTWATEFNSGLTCAPISGDTVRLASQIVGGAVTLPVRDAVVLQAISRVGLPNSAGALQAELQALAKTNPALASRILEGKEVTDETLHALVTDVVSDGLVRWYAYGLLAA